MIRVRNGHMLVSGMPHHAARACQVGHRRARGWDAISAPRARFGTFGFIGPVHGACTTRAKHC